MLSAEAPPDAAPVSLRLVTISGACILVGVLSGFVAKALIALIALITGVVFHHRITTVLEPPTADVVGHWMVVIPILGAIVIGLMARYGSAAIRGHGIPEVMEKVLQGESRIPIRVMFLKPLSAAIAIGTGGPFGAEGPIIATGGALGSMIGQFMKVTAEERKTLLAAGAAGGMAATFGAPVSAVLLAVELLLFEYRARSIIPVALGAAAAQATRLLLIGDAPVFSLGALQEPSWEALTTYLLIGCVVGLAAVGVTRSIYFIEDMFERLPIHWMWWPAIGAIAVGLVGLVDARALGVGYVFIDQILSGDLLGWSLAALIFFKFIAWAVYLGSGTSGGTLAPMFILGGGLGALLGSVVNIIAPGLGVNVPVAALVGMAAMFAGATHALLAAIVFAFEATRQPLSLLPLLGGGSGAYLIASLMGRTSLMTERLARRGMAVRPDYSLDYFEQVVVREVMTRDVETVSADAHVGEVWAQMAASAATADHQGFPVLSGDGVLLGVVTRRDLLGDGAPPGRLIAHIIKRPPVVAYPDNTLREAADHMVREGVGRLPVVERGTCRVVGIVTRSDLLSAHERRLKAATVRERPPLLHRRPRAPAESG